MAITIWKRESIKRSETEPYLERIILFRCRWFGILWHKFVGSDDECLHDHPWPFVSFILKGGYTEWTPTPIDEVVGMGPQVGRWHGRWSILFRPATWVHRVELKDNEPVTTLVIHGSKQRSWGFYTRFGFLHWSKYNYHQHCE